MLRLRSCSNGVCGLTGRIIKVINHSLRVVDIPVVLPCSKHVLLFLHGLLVSLCILAIVDV